MRRRHQVLITNLVITTLGVVADSEAEAVEVETAEEVLRIKTRVPRTTHKMDLSISRSRIQRIRIARIRISSKEARRFAIRVVTGAIIKRWGDRLVINRPHERATTVESRAT